MPSESGQSAALAANAGPALSEAEFVGLHKTYSRDLICLLDTNWRVVYASPSHERVLGLAPETLPGRPLAELLHPGDYATVLSAWQTLAKESSVEVTFRQRHADGTWCWLEAHVSLTRVNDAEHMVTVAHDVTKQRQAEAARRELESAYAELDALFTTAPVGLGLFDHELRFRRLNPTLATINGVGADEHLGKTLNDVLPDLSDNVAADIQQVLREQKPLVDREVFGRTPAVPSSLRSWLASYYPVFTKQQELVGVGAIVSETTGQKYIEAEQRKFVALVQNSTDLIGIASLEGRLQFLNAAAQRVTGLEGDAATTASISDCVAHEERAFVQRHILPTVLRHGGWVGELMMRNCHTNETIPTFVNIFLLTDPRSNRPIGFATVSRDIREQKRVEHRLRLLAQASAELGSSLDYETTLTNFARLAVEHFAHWCAVCIIEDGAQAEQLAVAHIDPARQSWFEEQLAEWPDGSHFPVARVLETGRSVFLPNLVAAADLPEETYQHLRSLECTTLISVPLKVRGQVLGAITFATTGTQHYTNDDVRLAEELANRAALAIENARLYREAQAAVGLRDHFLSIASHELKTPLTSMLGNLQLFQRRARRENILSERDQRTLQVIVDQTLRLNRLIGGLLDMSRLQSDHMEIEHQPVEIAALVRRVVEDMQLTLEHHTLTVTVPDAPQVVQGDVIRLEQVLQNLIQNAVKYSPHGGPIEVAVRSLDEALEIDVRDHGIGIPRESLPHLFDRFYRAPNVYDQNLSGMGIGLFVVREIISLHGGSVRVESSDGTGSTFTVILPLASG